MSSLKKLLIYFSPLIGSYLLWLLLFNIDTSERDSSGNIIGGGQVAFESLQIGDCFDYGPTFSSLGTVSAKPCTDPHDFEVFAVNNSALADYNSNRLSKEADDYCNSQVPFDRLDYLYNNGNEELRQKLLSIMAPDGSVYFYADVPTYDPAADVIGTWETGARQITCYLGGEDSAFIGKLL
jgi:hypothetical protein